MRPILDPSFPSSPQFRSTRFRLVGRFLLSISSFLLKLSDGRVSPNEVLFHAVIMRQSTKCC
jgi:hypothetical protein